MVSSNTSVPQKKLSSRLLRIGRVTLVCSVCVTLLYWGYQVLVPRELPLPSTVSEKEALIARESFQRQYGRPATRIDVLSWLAEWYLSRDRYSQAIECFAEIPTSHQQYGPMARYQQGRTLLQIHRAADAELQFSELIQSEEQSPTIEARYLVDARQRLRHILEVELRFEERQRLLRGVVGRREADPFETVAFCFPTQLRWNGPQAVKWIEEFFAAQPHDVNIRIALGRYRTGQGKLDEARQILEAVVGQEPGNLNARAALIACIREADAPEAVERLMADLPPQSADDSWLLLLQRGTQALHQRNGKGAVLAFEQMILHDHTSSQGWRGLVNACQLTGDREKRQRAMAVSAVLGRIQNHMDKVIQRPSDPDSYLDVADLCREIEFREEGKIMVEYALSIAPGNPRVLAANVEFQVGKMPPQSQESSRLP